MGKVIIRQCSVADIEQAANVVAEYSSYAIPGLPLVSVQWEQYRKLESAGAVKVFGAFDGDSLVGFASVITQVSLHYGTQISLSDSFYVCKAHRKSGAGLKLLKAMQTYAHSIGSTGFVVSAPHKKELACVLPKVGYVPSHTLFFKSLNHV